MKTTLLTLVCVALLAGCQSKQTDTASLMQAVELGDMRGVRHHLDETNVNTPDEMGRTPMSVAIIRAEHAIARYLLEHGATIPGDEPVAYLHYLIAWKDLEMITILLDHGLDPNRSYKQPDERQTTLLLHSAQGGFPGFVQLLLARGADPNLVCNNTPPIEAAVESGKIESVRALLNAGAKVTVRARKLAAKDIAIEDLIAAAE